MSKWALTVDSVSLRRGSNAILTDVSARFESGQIAVIVGPNGAGKSTLLRIMAGDLSPDAGHVTIGSRGITGFSTPDLARIRAVMPQQSVVMFGFTVREFVEMGLHPHIATKTREEQRVIVAGTLDTVDLTGFADRSILTLSGGEMQRASLARILAQITPVVLLDEPISSLDPAHQHQALLIARRLADDGKTVVVVLHDLTLAAQYADVVMVLHRGRVVAAGPPSQSLTAKRLSNVYGCNVHVGEVVGRPVITSW